MYRGNNELEQQQNTYRDFRDYIQSKLRSENNPDLSVIDFERMKEPGTTHLELPLINVKDPSSATEWEEVVRNFRQGAKLKLEPRRDGTIYFVAYVPFSDEYNHPQQPQANQPYFPRYAPSAQLGPDPFNLILWVFAFLVLMVIAGFRVRSDEWSYLASYFI